MDKIKLALGLAQSHLVDARNFFEDARSEMTMLTYEDDENLEELHKIVELLDKMILDSGELVQKEIKKDISGLFTM